MRRFWFYFYLVLIAYLAIIGLWTSFWWIMEVFFRIIDIDIELFIVHKS